MAVGVPVPSAGYGRRSCIGPSGKTPRAPRRGNPSEWRTLRRFLTGGAAVVGLLTSQGCATTGSGEPLTTGQKIAGCVAMVATGYALGRAIDDDGGERYGMAVAGAACAVWLAFASQRDRERLLLSQEAAAARGGSVEDRWMGDDGKERSVTVRASDPVPVHASPSTASAQAPGFCRKLMTEAEFEGRTESFEEVWCRDDDGNWAPAPGTSPAIAST